MRIAEWKSLVNNRSCALSENYMQVLARTLDPSIRVKLDALQSMRISYWQS